MDTVLIADSVGACGKAFTETKRLRTVAMNGTAKKTSQRGLFNALYTAMQSISAFEQSQVTVPSKVCVSSIAHKDRTTRFTFSSKLGRI